MDNLLSLITFLPLIGAIVLLVFLRGEDQMARGNAKMLALFVRVMALPIVLPLVDARVRPLRPRVPVPTGTEIA